MTARIVLLVAGAMAFLAASAAFAFQAVRNQPEVTVPVAVTAVPAQETVTPLTARPVRTVSIIKPGATLQNGSQFELMHRTKEHAIIRSPRRHGREVR